MIILVPFKWRGDYLFNGQLARPYDIFVSAGCDGYTSSGEDRDNVSIGLRKSRLQTTLAALAGFHPDRIKLRDGHVRLGSIHGQWLHKRLADLIMMATKAPKGANQIALSEVLESDFISDIAELLLPHVLFELPDKWELRSAPNIVRTAEREFERRGLLAPNLADLCAASGVRQTWLSKNFNEVYGTSPIKYLRNRRLSEARNMFFDRHAPPRSVKDVALSLGFLKSGRFANEYYKLFGEYPSRTLLTACKSHRTSESQKTRAL